MALMGLAVLPTYSCIVLQLSYIDECAPPKRKGLGVAPGLDRGSECRQDGVRVQVSSISMEGGIRWSREGRLGEERGGGCSLYLHHGRARCVFVGRGGEEGCGPPLHCGG